MGRLATEGAEAGTLALDNHFFNAPGDTTITTNPVRSGSYAFNTSNSYGVHTLAATKTELYIHFAVNFSGFGETFFSLANGAGLTELLYLRVTGANFISLTIAGVATDVAVSTIALQLNTWYVIDLYVKIGSSGQVTARIDGTQVFDYTGDTRGNSQTTIQHLRWRQHRLDDIAINDTSGGSDNGWIPDIHLVWVLVDSAGDSTQLTATGAGANWQAVNERPNNGDTSYVASSTTDQKDLYNLAAFTANGNVIRRVQPIAIARETVADGGKLAVGLKSASTEDWSPDRDLTTTYGVVYGKEYTADPADSAAWDDTKVSALQAGVKVR